MPVSVLDGKDKLTKILTTKFKHWEYESEYRMLIELGERFRVGDLYFLDFGVDLDLKEIFIGYRRSELTIEKILQKYRRRNNKVVIKYTRPAFRDFRIVWDRSKESMRV